MRQLNNKHFDTIEGASARQGEVVSSASRPLVSQQKDEIMNQEQKDLLISLVRKERVRLNMLLLKVEEDTEDEVRVEMERDLCTKTLKSLQGGK